MKPVLCSLLAAAAWYGSPDAYALPLVYTFTSTISSKTDPYGLIDDFNLGDQVTYTVNVDSDAENLSSTAGFGVFTTGPALLGIGGGLFSCNPTQVRIASESAGNPTAFFRAPIEGQISGLSVGGYFRLVDNDKSAISTPTLPIAPYPLALFELKDFSLVFWDPSRYGVDASVTGSLLSFEVVPEPSCVCYLTLLAVLSSRRKPR